MVAFARASRRGVSDSPREAFRQLNDNHRGGGRQALPRRHRRPNRLPPPLATGGATACASPPSSNHLLRRSAVSPDHPSNPPPPLLWLRRPPRTPHIKTIARLRLAPVSTPSSPPWSLQSWRRLVGWGIVGKKEGRRRPHGGTHPRSLALAEPRDCLRGRRKAVSRGM